MQGTIGPAVVATVVLLFVAASFPCFLHGAWIMLDHERITWSVLVSHLAFILAGLTLTTVPLVTWMAPRLLDQLGGFAAVHAFFGLQAYAFLAFGFTGIVRIFRAKYRHDLYTDYDEDVLLEEIGARIACSRRRSPRAARPRRNRCRGRGGTSPGRSGRYR